MLNRACSSCQTPSSKFLELFAQFQVLQALGSSSNPPKVPPAAPLTPPGRPKNTWGTALSRPRVAIIRFLAFQEPPKTSKIEAQGVSELDFGAFWEPFWHTFSEIFPYFYDKGEKRADTVIPQ